MEVYENINRLLKKRSISKKYFCENLSNLGPTLKRTGEPPSVKTVYKYLQGALTIPIELVPYIAEALQVPEQELFRSDQDKNMDYIRYYVENSTLEEIEKLKSYFHSYNGISSGKIDVAPVDLEKIEEVLKLLPYAPKKFLEEVVEKLQMVKKSLSS